MHVQIELITSFLHMNNTTNSVTIEKSWAEKSLENFRKGEFDSIVQEDGDAGIQDYSSKATS